MSALIAVLVFFAAAVIDYAETRYVRAVHDRDRVSAATWSLVMWALGCLGFVAVVDVSLWYMLPEGLGFFAGTWLAMRPPVRSTPDRSLPTA
jgi:hypothetical protein